MIEELRETTWTKKTKGPTRPTRTARTAGRKINSTTKFLNLKRIVKIYEACGLDDRSQGCYVCRICFWSRDVCHSELQIKRSFMQVLRGDWKSETPSEVFFQSQRSLRGKKTFFSCFFEDLQTYSFIGLFRKRESSWGPACEFCSVSKKKLRCTMFSS